MTMQVLKMHALLKPKLSEDVEEEGDMDGVARAAMSYSTSETGTAAVNLFTLKVYGIDDIFVSRW